MKKVSKSAVVSLIGVVVMPIAIAYTMHKLRIGNDVHATEQYIAQWQVMYVAAVSVLTGCIMYTISRLRSHK